MDKQRCMRNNLQQIKSVIFQIIAINRFIVVEARYAITTIMSFYDRDRERIPCMGGATACSRPYCSSYVFDKPGREQAVAPPIHVCSLIANFDCEISLSPR